MVHSYHRSGNHMALELPLTHMPTTGLDNDKSFGCQFFKKWGVCFLENLSICLIIGLGMHSQTCHGTERTTIYYGARGL